MPTATHPFTTMYEVCGRLESLPMRDQEQVEQMALAHLAQAYRYHMKSLFGDPSVCEDWRLWAECALEHAMDKLDICNWTSRRMQDTIDWLMKSEREIKLNYAGRNDP